MASSEKFRFVREDGIIYDYSDVAPAPCKDFCNIVVDGKKKTIIYRCWKISPRSAESKVPPVEVKDTFEEFLEDDRLNSEIQRVFGVNTLHYVENLVKGHIDYLPRLPSDYLLNILSYLELEDLARMAQVSKKFHELCMSDELWEKVYRQNSEAAVTEELASLARDVGWRKLFFTNKLQLQVQINRQRKRKVEDMSEEDEAESTDDSVQLRRQARKKQSSGGTGKVKNKSANNSGGDTFLTEELY